MNTLRSRTCSDDQAHRLLHTPMVALLTAALALLSVGAWAQTAPEDAPGASFPSEEEGRWIVSAPAPVAAPAVAPAPPGPPPMSTWIAQGSAPAVNGQVENVSPNDEVVGAIHTVIAHPSDANILWIGTVNGGIWRTGNATAGSPMWVPQTDSQNSLSIGAMDLDPTDVTNNTLVAGIGRYSSFGQVGGTLTEGLLRTTNGGTTWTPINDPLLSGESCSGIAARGSTILFSGNEFTGPFPFGGLYRSTDTGASWTKIDGLGGSGLPAEDVHDLVGDPNTNTRFYLTLDNFGVYRSDDSGATWTNISDATQTTIFGGGGNNNAELAMSPGGRLYAGIILSGRPLYIGYTDNPTAVSPTWTRMDLPTTPASGGVAIAGATNASPIAITTGVAHGFSSGSFASVTGVTGNTAANGVHRITVTGATTFDLQFTTGNGAYGGGGTATAADTISPREKAGGQGGLHFSLLADNANVFMAGDRQDSPFVNFIGATDFSGNLWRGLPGVAPTGATPSPQWEHLTHSNAVVAIFGGGTLSSSAPHADSREMVFDADGNIIEVDDGGIYRRTFPVTNAGDWFSINGDLQVSEQHDIAYDSVANIIMSGNQDTGTQQQQSTGSLMWDSVSTADGGDVAVDDSGVNSFRYSSFQNLGAFRRREYNSGNVFQGQVFPGLIGAAGWAPRFTSPVEVNAVTPAQIVIGGSNGILESFNMGNNVTYLVTTGINNDCLAYGANGMAQVLYAASGSSVLVRLAGFGAPVVTAAAHPGGSVTDLVINPGDENECFVTSISGGSAVVYQTTDAGATVWNNITGNLTEEDVRSIVYIPDVGGDQIAVGTGHGVHSMELSNPGVWTQLGIGLPNAPVYDMDYDAADDVLVAGTMGRGAWSLSPPFPVPTAAVLGGTKTVTGDFTEGGTIAYTVTITNSGVAAQGDNPGDEFTDTLPGTLTLTNATLSGGGGTVGTAGNTVTWNGGLAVGASVEITIDATISGGTAGMLISNQGTISYDSNNDNTNNALALTDDPGVGGVLDPTDFSVFGGAGGTFCSAPGAAIPDNTPAGLSDDLVIGAMSTIADLNVSLEITHTWVGDLRVMLEHVDTGTSVVLFDRPGVPPSSVGCNDNDLRVLLDDELLPPPIDDNSLCETGGGTFYPTGPFPPANPLTAFDGENISGTWRLNVSDNFAFDLGTLDEWCLIVGSGAIPTSDLSVVKDDGLSEVDPGQTVMYDIVVSNGGPDDAVGVPVVDTFPAELTNAVWSATTSAGASVSNTMGMGDIAETVDLVAGATVTFEVMAEVASSAAAAVVNTALVGFAGNDPDLANNSSTDTDVVRLPDLTLTKTADCDPVLAGQEFHFVLTVSNSGSSEATGVQVIDTLDPAVVVLADTCGGVVSGDTWIWNVGTLGVGQTVSCEITATPISCCVIDNTATVTADQTDQNLADNTDSLTLNMSLNILGDPSFEAGLPNPVWLGDSPTQNPGNPHILTVGPPFSRTGLRFLFLVETASAEQTVIAIPPSHEAVLKLHLWNLVVGASPEDVVQVFIDATEVASVNNGDPAFFGGYGRVAVDVSAFADGASHEVRIVSRFNNPPGNTQFLVDDVTLSICPQFTDLAITKSDSPDPVTAGDPLVYTLEVTNFGPGVGTDTVVIDTLPAGVTVTNVTTTQGTAEVTGNTVSFELGGVTPPKQLIVNGSFETRDLTGWTVVQTPVTTEFLVSAVYASGTTTGFFSPSAPVDGQFSYMNGFDGFGPFTYDVFQEVTIPPNAISADLSWAEELQWDLITFCVGCSSREYEVTVQPAGGGAPIATLFAETAPPNTSRSGSGEVFHAVDLLTLPGVNPGDTVRLNWHELIPDNFSGPAQFELDAVSLIATTAPSTVIMTIETTVDTTTQGLITNTAVVTTTQLDTNLANNVASEETTVLRPEIDAGPSSIDFGTQINSDGPSSPEIVTISNAGNDTLDLTSITLEGPASPEFSITSGGGAGTLAAGASREVEIVFDPTFSVIHTASLRIESNDADEPAVLISLTGEGMGSGLTGLDPVDLVRALLGIIPASPEARFNVNMDAVFDSADVVTDVNFINAP